MSGLVHTSRLWHSIHDSVGLKQIEVLLTNEDAGPMLGATSHTTHMTCEHARHQFSASVKTAALRLWQQVLRMVKCE